MSGGSFDYAFGRVDQFADELGVRLDEHDRTDEYGDTPNAFEPETRAKLREIERLARYTAKLMREAEWLYSGDTSDDSFMERVRKIESYNVESNDAENGKTLAGPAERYVMLPRSLTAENGAKSLLIGEFSEE